MKEINVISFSLCGTRTVLMGKEAAAPSDLGPANFCHERLSHARLPVDVRETLHRNWFISPVWRSLCFFVLPSPITAAFLFSFNHKSFHLLAVGPLSHGEYHAGH